MPRDGRLVPRQPPPWPPPRPTPRARPRWAGHGHLAACILQTALVFATNLAVWYGILVVAYHWATGEWTLPWPF